jgi:hypothetical protein
VFITYALEYWVYVFDVGYIDYETLFHVVILNKHHYHHQGLYEVSGKVQNHLFDLKHLRDRLLAQVYK